MDSGLIRIGNIEVHPAARLFPEMGEDDLRELYESVKVNGVRSPLQFFEGKLLDGRNRVRAALMAGLDVANLPRRNLSPDTDPFQYAWDANCERLNYAPKTKADIAVKIAEASGELARLRAGAAARANASRSEKAKAQIAEQPRDGAGKVRPGGAPRDARPGLPPPPRKIAKEIAEKAGVSTRTAERALRRRREGPEALDGVADGPPARTKRRPSKWSVPRDVGDMAKFLRERLTLAEITRLVKLLTESKL